MSDTSKPTKISREGVILIKSFEGFRPRAIQRADGRWTIGYGHTQSAREGLTVSESDAELLLQYDLIPVAQTVKAIQAPLNQHQFDALASFAFSVGVDRFKTSDVLARLNAGAPLEAANALMTWVEDADVFTPPRRRAAERALFVADPEAPASLADLLAIPLPPATATLVESTAEAEPHTDEVEAESVEPAPFPAFPPSQAVVDTVAEAPPSMTREAAISALLGDVEEDAPVEADTESAAAETMAAVEPAPAPSEPEGDSPVEATPDVAPETPDQDEEPESIQPIEADVEPSDVEPSSVPASAPPSPRPVSPVMTSAATFYSPYAVRALGPLAGFGLRGGPRPTAAQTAPTQADAANDAPPADLESETPQAPTDAHSADEAQADDTADDTTANLPADARLEDAEPTPESTAESTPEPAPPAVSADAAEQIEVAVEAAADDAPQATATTDAASDEEPAAAVESPVEVPMFASVPLPIPQPTPQPTPLPFEGAPLALTGVPTAQAAPDTRLVWPEHNDLTHPDQTPLFEQEATPVQQDAPPEPARPTAPSFKLEWTETLTFLAMGGIGLLSFGAAMAAFRQSSQSDVDTGLIGWALVVIALACVGASGFNLYKRWGRVDRD
ncbi:glycoside hydrolase family protein [Brevundimonas sp. SL130]|uniref:glycoside hydrolase family protein n=1 Tax=Brevundimonas sp. SL130 TaxID=2995143 RepID=UPI00226D35A1|nr:glycoside hydrolase family protein [Brevundimonas sp. SL130]WAC61399.1 glycoside hydrolase family protein [Brevundimonas sp. SL130]